jgi:histidinol-phosphate aminotransferase
MIATAQANRNIKLIFVCSPGNPTCKAINKHDIRRLATACADHALIVVDEAYIDFCPNEMSALDLVRGDVNNEGDNGLPNVCVLQTLSKAFGLAALRCGFLFAGCDVIQLMNNVKAPYNINALSSRAAIAAFDQIATVQANVQQLIAQRGIVMTALTGLSCVESVYPSDSNFILFRLTAEHNAEHVYKIMADQGIVTRFRGSELHCHNCIRVTVGTASENQAFLALLTATTSAAAAVVGTIPNE